VGRTPAATTRELVTEMTTAENLRLADEQDDREIDSSDERCAINGRLIVAWFSTRWFIFVMSTGAVANIHQMLAGGPSGWLHTSAVALLLIAAVAFIVVSGVKLWRLVQYGRCIREEWKHSSLMQFYAAIPIAAAVVSTGFLNIPIGWLPEAQRVVIAETYWAVALAFSVVLVVLIPTHIILGEHAEPRRALGFWFLPPVGLFVLVFNGNFLSGHLQNPTAVNGLFALNTIILGLALCLTAVMFTIFLFRSLFYRFPRPDVTPSFTIGLAPIGVSIIALHSYLPLYGRVALQGLPPVETLAPLVNLGTLLLWAFGLWWALVVVGIIATKALRGGIPVTLGFWAFVFPPAAYTLSTILLASKLSFAPLSVTGNIFAVAVTATWLIVAILVARATHNGTIFELPPSFADIDTTVA